MSPEGKKEVVQSGTQIVVSERVKFIRASNTASMIVSPQCEISVQCTAHYIRCVGSQQAIQGEKHTRLFSYVASLLEVKKRG